jgi:hypothetical protein
MKYPLLVLLACAFPLIAQAKPVPAPHPAAPSPLRSDIPVVPAGPKDEQQFIAIIQNAQKEYAADKSDDARKNTRVAQQIAVQKFLGLNHNAADWVGTFKNRDKTEDGDLTAEIQIAPGITITTFSTRYFDGASETLLRQNSSLFNTVKDLTIGQPITFSASLLGAMISSDADMVMYPHIIARFTKIDKVD